jgi:putative integral membrane protein (TIGR02587 family)
MVAGDLAPDHAAEGAWEMSMSHDDRAAGASHPFLRLFVAERAFYLALARAFGGAVLFALPLLMTMEMWWLGFLIRPERLALFLLLAIPLLWTLSWLAGFREDVSWRDALVDAGIAYLVGILASAAVLLLLAAIEPGMPLYEILGKVALQAVPAGMGAALARSQLGLREEEEKIEPRRETYAGELFLMAAGALFLAFNIAPTEEIVLIAHQQASPWYGIALVLASLLVLHAFVYAVGFHGQHGPPPDRSPDGEFLRLTLPGYAVVLLVCLYVLWTFGRLDGVPPHVALQLVLVLGFPGALGAATARLVL